MAGGYSITPEELIQAGNHVNSVANQVEDLLNQIKGQVTSTTDFWQGAGHSSFQMLMDRWNRDAQDLHMALVAIANGMITAGNHYSETETGTINAFNV